MVPSESDGGNRQPSENPTQVMGEPHPVVPALASPTPDSITPGPEVLNAIMANASAYIGSADSKATGLLAVSGALLALLVALAGAAAQDKQSEATTIQFGFALFALLLAGSVATASAVLLPRTDRVAILRPPFWKKPYVQSTTAILTASHTYFGDVTSLKSLEAVAQTGVPTTDMTRDRIEQVYVLARIASKKLFWMRVSVWLLLASLLVLLIVIGLRLFPGEKNAEQSRPEPPPQQTSQPTS